MSKRQMLINYVPGEECRVAVVEGGQLEEFHAERMDGPSNHVGNIYVGKVANVEPGIQAAFVDFGLEQNGFLHTSDVHPQYFPGEESDKTERVGRKTPRRERPPIQDCLRRGDEIAVQVLKEGVGTKGPTVTSYLSIPGRFLVMMPQMDKVGVSRKVEDEEQRRKMREILDQLDLPDGFGFILRTAGFDRTKAELKRDLAYLMRLWKDMERRWRSGAGKPRLLYSESDLLVRALRDILTGDIEEIVVDNEAALQRAARFLRIVSPRTTTRLVHYTGKAPIFHTLGVEPQIQMIHAREVPLPSGGRLVIDEAEAVVAIDVNSGKMRDARDAEATAYKTNMEAADEICRQLRLRDIGGVVVNDFIDMRQMKHRRDLENQMRENLKKDRARWTLAPVSEFGIIEMTRQRMRASHESQHFADCPTCRGRGLVQRPDSVAGSSLRDLTALLDQPRVARVEMVVHPRVAGELLSTKRRSLSRIERTLGKRVDVRVSDAIAVDRVTFYAYDDRGADLDLAAISPRQAGADVMKVYEIKADAADLADVWSEADNAMPPEPEFDDEPAEEVAELHPIEIEPTDLSEYLEPARPYDQPRGRGGHHQGQHHGQHQGHHGQHGHQHGHDDAGSYGPGGGQGGGPGGEQGEGGRRRRRRRRGRGRGGQDFPAGQPGYANGAGNQPGYDNTQGYGPAGDDFADDRNQYAQPGYDQPQGYNQPGYGQQDYAQPAYGQPGFDQPGYDNAQGYGPAGDDFADDRNQYAQPGGYAQPGYAQSGHAQPGYDQPYNGDGPDGHGGPDGPDGPGGPGEHDGPGDPGEQGEGGRRRRRRRRGRRGRGGAGSGPAGPDGYANGPQHGHADGGYDQPYPNQPYPNQPHDRQYGQPGYGYADNGGNGDSPAYPPTDGPFDPAEQPGGYQGEPVIEDDAPLADAAPAPIAQDADAEVAPDSGPGGDEGGDGTGRRRRRRRGGRGRGRDRDGAPSDDAPNGAPNQPGPDGLTPAQADVGSQPDAESEPAEPAPQPEVKVRSSEPPLAAVGSSTPKPRTLYSFRRKLGPGETKGPRTKPREE